MLGMRVSVALCTYNGSKYITTQLDSILEQIEPINEIVVCDDGSLDDTLEKVKDVSLRNPQLLWKIQKNNTSLGVIKNFEKAISLCTGDIIFLSDQDDVWHKDKTKVTTKFFNDNPSIDVVFTDANLIGEDGSLITDYSLLDAMLLKPYFALWESGLKFEILNVRPVATGATMAFRRSCMDSFLPFDDDKYILHDYQIILASCRSNSLGVLKEKLIDYRQHENNVIGVKHDNWIYTSKKAPSLLSMIVEPYPIRKWFKGWECKRVSFYKLRIWGHSTIPGKLRLIMSIPLYIKFYGKFGWIFFASDILYGVNYKLRSWLINRY